MSLILRLSSAILQRAAKATRAVLRGIETAADAVQAAELAADKARDEDLDELGRRELVDDPLDDGPPLEVAAGDNRVTLTGAAAAIARGDTSPPTSRSPGTVQRRLAPPGDEDAARAARKRERRAGEG